jgi:hypothetical protein
VDGTRRLRPGRLALAPSAKRRRGSAACRRAGLMVMHAAKAALCHTTRARPAWQWGGVPALAAASRLALRPLVEPQLLPRRTGPAALMSWRSRVSALGIGHQTNPESCVRARNTAASSRARRAPSRALRLGAQAPCSAVHAGRAEPPVRCGRQEYRVRGSSPGMVVFLRAGAPEHPSALGRGRCLARARRAQAQALSREAALKT